MPGLDSGTICRAKLTPERVRVEVIASSRACAHRRIPAASGPALPDRSIDEAQRGRHSYAPESGGRRGPLTNREAAGSMAAPGLKEMAQSRELKVGHFIVEFATPGIGQILKSAGCDFALFDCEHSGFGYETIKSVLRYMQAADLPTIVRVPSREYHHIARAADMGAEGIMLPMVGSADEARTILDSHEVPSARAARRGARRGPRPLYARADAGKARGGQPMDHPVRPDRDPPGRRERRCDRGDRGRRLPVGRPLRSQRLARHPGSVRAQGLHRCHPGR